MSRLSSTLANLLLSLPLAAGLLGSTASAQLQTRATTTIPFAFSANNQHLLAGSYEVQFLSDRFLCLRNIKTATTQCLAVRPEPEHILETKSHLVFHRDGERSYLTQVWIAGTNKHSELIVQPKLERQLAKEMPPAASSVEVALR